MVPISRSVLLGLVSDRDLRLQVLHPLRERRRPLLLPLQLRSHRFQRRVRLALLLLHPGRQMVVLLPLELFQPLDQVAQGGQLGHLGPLPPDQRGLLRVQ
eukprot:1180714-Prorocentrum_minimum.AAC.2